MSINTQVLNIQPVCQANGCQKGCQVMAKYGSKISYFKTCVRHTYRDLVLHKLQSNNNK